MRLLKTGPYVPGKYKLELIQQWGSEIPPYAVLSHTWSSDPEEEVLFADVQNGTSATKPAFAKLQEAMKRAELDGYGWLWIDTCCIDKTSSVELSEAINSMYRYYENAQKCYAYLSDVTLERRTEQFGASRWWSRGWTLQELLAPQNLEFFSSGWMSLGTKASQTTLISRITTVDVEYLSGVLPLQHASIAKRMSWAATRRTTREEDIAYCLMGLFEVNMPMLYGEGGKQAFVRLQEAIMNGSEDQSLFAWIKSDSDEDGPYHGLLADSPKDFKHTGSTQPYSELADYNPTNMTARGLHMTVPITRKEDGTSIAALQCPVPSRGYNDWLAIYLKQLPTGANQYARVTCDKLASISELGKPQEIYVRQHFPKYPVPTVYPSHFFLFRSLQCTEQTSPLQAYKLVEAVHETSSQIETSYFPSVARQRWSNIPLVYKINKTAGALSAAIVVFRPFDGEVFALMIGSSSEFEVGFDVCEAVELGTFQQMQKAFHAKPPGQLMELEFHNVRVRVEERVRSGQKIYFLDMVIEAIPRAPTVTEMVEDAVDLFTHPINSPQHDVSKAGLVSKVKRLWPTA